MDLTADQFNARPRPKAPRTNLVGQTFGHLKVVKLAGRANRGHLLWECLCCCGTTTWVTTSNLRGTTSSCGCARRAVAAGMNRIHGESETPLHRHWRAMVNRVTNANSPNFGNYGGRGITIAERWLEPHGVGFMNFRADMGDGFREGLTLDRIDVNGPYSPENCRWATAKEQARNTRRNRILTLWGQAKSLAEWCELLDLKYDTAKRRLQRGWSAHRTLTNDAGPAAVWNKLHPVGTPVIAYPGIRPEYAAHHPGAADLLTVLETRTRSAAWNLGHGEPVVAVDGYAGGISLEHIDLNTSQET